MHFYERTQSLYTVHDMHCDISQTLTMMADLMLLNKFVRSVSGRFVVDYSHNS